MILVRSRGSLSGWRRGLGLLFGVLGMLGLYFSVPIDSSSPNQTLRIVISLAVAVLVVLTMILQIRLHLQDQDRKVDGLLFALVAIVLCFALGFYAMEVHAPEQLDGLRTRVDALYFTLVSMATVGYGDVHAVGQLARAVVIGQIVFTIVVLSTAVSLVGSRIRIQVVRRGEARVHADQPAPDAADGEGVGDGGAPPGRRSARKHQSQG